MDKLLDLCRDEMSVLFKVELFICWHENNYSSSIILAER